jgi:gamma-glutamyltranspeptidase/glutathione hydrolase
MSAVHALPCRAALVLVAVLLGCGERELPGPAPTARVTPGVVAADHELASEAGAAMLRAGGNAVDAAVAAALAAGVVQPHSSGLGGGGFAIVVRPGSDPVALDFRETAPAAAHAGMFLDEAGEVVPGLSELGALAVAVPGEPRGLAMLQRRYGSLSLEQVAAPAIGLARDGFPVGEALARASATWSHEHGDTLFPGLFDGQSGPPQQGVRVRRGALAETLEAWASGEGEVLNEGARALGLADGLGALGGVLSAADLAGYRPVERRPLVGRYRDWTLVSMPPPSSGGVVILQVLAVLEAWPPPGGGLLDPPFVLRAVEALEHAFADRARWMGDPDFVSVPVDRLLSPERVAAVQAGVRRALGEGQDAGCATLPSEAYGLPLDPGEDHGTHHISVIDGDGLAVALTTTINTSFGSGVVDPGSGLLLNDEMDDFVAAPGVPNHFGLVGNERNAVAPGKRPLSSMSPTVVLDAAGRPVLVVGASGGPRIISATLEVLLAVLEGGYDVQAAVALPRYHHQWLPRRVRVDPELSPETVQALEACGHQVGGPAPGAAVQAVQRLPDGRLLGASDPRKGGAPVVVE